MVVEQLWEMKKEQPSPVEGKDPCGVPVLVLGHSPVDLLVVVCGLELWEREECRLGVLEVPVASAVAEVAVVTWRCPRV